MALIAPFRALRYNPARIPDLAEVVAPPYDVISSREEEELRGRSPYNCVRLILGKGEDPHRQAAATLAAWRQEGVLLRDKEPALYLVEDRYRIRNTEGRDVERRRRGLVGLVRIESPESGVVLPHERTLAGPRDDRFRRLRAVDAHLSPVFLLAPDPEGALSALCEEASEGETLVTFANGGGGRHQMIRVGESGLIARIEAALNEQPLLIVDGHHRYETARAYRDVRRGAAGGGGERSRPYDHVMALVASLDDPGTTVLGYHRVLRDSSLPADELRDRLRRMFTVTPVARAGDPAARTRLLTAMESAAGGGETAFGLAQRGEGELYLVSRARSSEGPLLSRLDVSVLHGSVLEGVLGMTEDDFSRQRRIDYTPDPDRALARIASGSHAAAFLLNPTPPADVLAVARGGNVMPQKSTYFHPKLLTGLTFHAMDPDNGS
jgi:uncharacterized protein (DUF1015 family)